MLKVYLFVYITVVVNYVPVCFIRKTYKYI